MDLKELVKVGEELVAAQVRLEEAEQATKRAKNDVRVLAEDVLPAMLDEVGLEEIKLADGTRIAVEKKILVQPRAENRDAILAWLESIELGALIKDEVTVAFSVGESEKAAELVAALREQQRSTKTKRWVEPQTLMARVREMVKSGAEVPADLLGLETKRQAIFAERAKVEPCPFGDEN